MKGLATLIKLHTRTLDELRRKMVSLENQKEQLLRTSERLKQELVDEIKTASENPEMGQFFGDFSKRIQRRQEEIVREVAALDQQMKELNVKIAEAFSEVKKFEIALDNARKRVAAERDRLETLALDEVAGQQFDRKKRTED